VGREHTAQAWLRPVLQAPQNPEESRVGEPGAETPAHLKAIGLKPPMAGEDATRGSHCRVPDMAEIREN
jgi:hypothetical protein